MPYVLAGVLTLSVFWPRPCLIKLAHGSARLTRPVTAGFQWAHAAYNAICVGSSRGFRTEPECRCVCALKGFSENQVSYILTLSITSEVINYQTRMKWFWTWMLQKQMCFINLPLCRWMSCSKVYCLGTGMENKGAHKARVIELWVKRLWDLRGI